MLEGVLDSGREATALASSRLDSAGLSTAVACLTCGSVDIEIYWIEHALAPPWLEDYGTLLSSIESRILAQRTSRTAIFATGAIRSRARYTGLPSLFGCKNACCLSESGRRPRQYANGVSAHIWRGHPAASRPGQRDAVRGVKGCCV